MDFAAESDPEAKPESGPARPPLSRQPGRIFGPKPSNDAPAGEPLTPLTPAGGTAPPEPAPVAPDLSRNPGKLFPRK